MEGDVYSWSRAFLIPITTPAPTTLPTIKIGDIVVRGPDWEWNDQDGGEGCKGIVLSDPDSQGWVKVVWSEQGENNYRWGHGNCYDLRILSQES